MEAAAKPVTCIYEDIFISASSILQHNCSICLSTELALIFQRVKRASIILLGIRDG
jgi:hypothetical protein